jgi:hypothetical protein
LPCLFIKAIGLPFPLQPFLYLQIISSSTGFNSFPESVKNGRDDLPAYGLQMRYIAGAKGCQLPFIAHFEESPDSR